MALFPLILYLVDIESMRKKTIFWLNSSFPLNVAALAWCLAF